MNSLDSFFDAKNVEEVKKVFEDMSDEDKAKLNASCKAYLSGLPEIFKLGDQFIYEDTFCRMGMIGLCNLSDDAHIRLEYCVVGNNKECPAQGGFL